MPVAIVRPLTPDRLNVLARALFHRVRPGMDWNSADSAPCREFYRELVVELIDILQGETAPPYVPIGAAAAREGGTP